ncbi:RNA polymerase sigma factor [bacterium]|nr:RNA polymerase sigma factor [bacterium]
MNKPSKSDAELVVSILAANKDDFAVLMERYQQRIFSYLYRFLYQNKEAALDVTQNVFSKVYENLGSFDTKFPMQSWIYRIAHNEAANYLRTISRRKESHMDDDQWSSIPGSDLSNGYEQEENRKLVLRALEKIDPKYREILVLSYFEEKSYKEIAEILDTSTNTVGTLIRRAKKQMEKTLNSMVGRADWFTQIIFRSFLIVFPTHFQSKLRS